MSDPAEPTVELVAARWLDYWLDQPLTEVQARALRAAFGIIKPGQRERKEAA